MHLEAIPKKSPFLEGSNKYLWKGTFTNKHTFPKGKPRGDKEYFLGHHPDELQWIPLIARESRNLLVLLNTTGADVDERVAAARGDLHPEEHQAEGDHRDEEEGEPGEPIPEG